MAIFIEILVKSSKMIISLIKLKIKKSKLKMTIKNLKLSKIIIL